MTTPPAPQSDPVRVDVDDARAMTVLSRETVSAGAARKWLSDFVGSKGVTQEAASSAVLVISELVTNALRHGLGEVVVRALVNDRGGIHLAVTDSSDDPPQVLPVDPKRIGGLGLHIVSGLADEWGVTPFPGGKTVWATVPLSETA